MPAAYIAVHLGLGSEAGQRAGPDGALQGAGKDRGEAQARETPGGLAVPRKIEDRKYLVHKTALGDKDQVVASRDART